MWGKPFETLKQALLNVGNLIFSADVDSDKFNTVNMVFYNQYIGVSHLKTFRQLEAVV